MGKVLVEVYGCSANVADAEIVSGLLLEAGHSLTDSLEDADAAVLLTCVVKTPTERKILKRIASITGGGKPLVVAGCMPKTLRGSIEEVAPGACLVGPDDVARVPDAVGAALLGRKQEYLSGSSLDRCLMPRVRRNGVIHIAPIAAGCLGNCAYCIVKHARGRLHSFPADMIVEDARRAIADGCREIWLTAEDTACYESGGVRLPELIRMITELPGRFYVRVGMMTPNHARDILGDLVEVFNDLKVFRFLHVPVQAGSDVVLKRMRRYYLASEFRETISAFRSGVPDLTVSTDIICGFPGETEEEWRETVGLVEWLRPDALNISRYWTRPGTEAAAMRQLPGREIKRRSTELDALWNRLNRETTEKWRGWEGDILLDEPGRRGTVVGRNYAYKAVAIPAGPGLGEFVRVRAEEADMGFLTGTRIG